MKAESKDGKEDSEWGGLQGTGHKGKIGRCCCQPGFSCHFHMVPARRAQWESHK